MNSLPKAVLDLPIRGAHLRGETLGEHLGDRTVAIAFVRHFG